LFLRRAACLPALGLALLEDSSIILIHIKPSYIIHGLLELASTLAKHLPASPPLNPESFDSTADSGFLGIII
jgi:hypothetical protein